MKVTTMRGVTIDIARFLEENADTPAIGNANLNARGDLIGPGGKVVKKREEIAAEYHSQNPRAVKRVALKDVASESMSPAEAVAAARAEAQRVKAAEEAAAQAETDRRIRAEVEAAAASKTQRRIIEDDETI